MQNEQQHIKAAVVGAAGYTGLELIRLLLQHPTYNLVAVSSNANAGQAVSKLYPALASVSSACDLVFQTHDELLAAGPYDLVFLAVPHTKAMGLVAQLNSHCRCVIDLSADFRLRDAATYQEWYGVEHTATELLSQAIYGLPEMTGALLQQAADTLSEDPGQTVIIANPGCYPTASTLAVLPLLQHGLVNPGQPIVVNAISGISGAGKSASSKNLFGSALENAYAYSPLSHRHTPEIEQNYSWLAGQPLQVLFTPHLVPMVRGMVATVAVRLASDVDMVALNALYHGAYDQQPCVEFCGQEMPQSLQVRGTNQARVGFVADFRTNSVVASCVIDNLGKGASAQAVQNANLVFGLPQTTGLTQIAAAL
jgi:N-acetyl-gamma-glutamyl-phosphate reductase